MRLVDGMPTSFPGLDMPTAVHACGTHTGACRCTERDREREEGGEGERERERDSESIRENLRAAQFPSRVLAAR